VLNAKLDVIRRLTLAEEELDEEEEEEGLEEGQI